MLFFINNVESSIYKVMFFFILFSFLLSSILFLVSVIIAFHNPYYEKITAYECGFEPFEDARNKFDVKFYIVAILFIIFDIEIIFLLPWLLNIVYIGIQGFWSMILFLVILGLGFLYEIIKGALDW